MATPPIIDDRVQHVTASHLRTLNGQTLKELEGPLVVQVDGEPRAVIIRYDRYLEMQKAFWPSSLFDTLEKIVDLAEDGQLLSALSSLQACFAAGLPAATMSELALRHTEQGLRGAPRTTPTLPADHLLCVHCNELFRARPGATSLCAVCFGEGHRNGNCMKCAEQKETERRAKEDHTGADRDDVDRLAFTE